MVKIDDNQCRNNFWRRNAILRPVILLGLSTRYIAPKIDFIRFCRVFIPFGSALNYRPLLITKGAVIARGILSIIMYGPKGSLQFDNNFLIIILWQDSKNFTIILVKGKFYSSVMLMLVFSIFYFFQLLDQNKTTMLKIAYNFLISIIIQIIYTFYSPMKSPNSSSFVQKQNASFIFRPSYQQEHYNEQEMLKKIREFNSDFESNQSRIARLVRKPRSFLKIKMEIPSTSPTATSPYFLSILKKEKNRRLQTLVPPKLRSKQEIADAKMVKKFSKRYEFLWILIVSDENIECKKQFGKLYQQDQLSNKNRQLSNILGPKNSNRVQIFTQQGIDVKVLCDYKSFEESVQHQLKELQNNPKILQAHFEEDANGYPAISKVTNKLKNENNLIKFIRETIKGQFEKSRKDVAYFNFIHSDSGPQLFNRRSIIQQCLYSKHQEQTKENHRLFVRELERWNRKQYEKDLCLLKQATPEQYQTLKNRLERKRDRLHKFKAEFASKMEKYIIQNSPIEQQSEEKKKQIYSWVVFYYVIESAVYPVVNNTMRFSLNSQVFKPISIFTRYLYEAIRFYFLNNYRRINFSRVFRGSRVSLVQQKSFVAGKYLWNLGFMSTSVDEEAARDFLRSKTEQEGVLVIIDIDKNATRINHLQNHEGFYMLQKINFSDQNLPNDEKQVLFNPLNVFSIISWQDNTLPKTLHLKFAPHLDLLNKKAKELPLNVGQKKILTNISKLKSTNFDKGIQLVESGNTIEAISYYQKSEQTGESLSFRQKNKYLQMLKQVGDYEKMESLLRQAVNQEEQSIKKMQDSLFSVNNQSPKKIRSSQNESNLRKTEKKLFTNKQIYESLEISKLYSETTNYEQANEKAQQTALMAIQYAEQEEILSLQTAELQIRSYIEVAKIKFTINQSLDSIKQNIKCFQMMDEIPKIVLYQSLHGLGKSLRKVKGLNVLNKHLNIQSILQQKNILHQHIDVVKQRAYMRFRQIREDQQFEKQLLRRSSMSQNLNKSHSRNKHEQAEVIMRNYFKKRDRDDEYRNLFLVFGLASWEIQQSEINPEKMTEKQLVQERQKLKQIKQEFMHVRTQYAELIEIQRQIYEILYRNIYKTNMKIDYCLRSYNLNLFGRYHRFITQMEQYEQPSLEVARILRLHGEIMQEYGSIIQRDQITKDNFLTSSEEQGMKKLEKAKTIIRQIEKQIQTSNSQSSLYFQKASIDDSLSKFYKGKIIDKEKMKKLSVVNLPPFTQTREMIKKQQKKQMFSQLIKTVQRKKSLHSSNKSLNPTVYNLNDTVEKIQIMNESHGIQIENQTYPERLKSCMREYQSFCRIVEKYKQQQKLERNENLSNLYLLMAENQYRLGLYINAWSFIERAKQSLDRCLKLDKRHDKKQSSLDLKKLEYGNSIKIGILKLQSHIVAFFGKEKEKKKFLKELMGISDFIGEKMHQPLNEADIKQSVGLLYANLMFQHQSPQKKYKLKDIYRPMLKSIQIRQELFGPYNKYNARVYSILMEVTTKSSIDQSSSEAQKFYKEAHLIYNKIDFSSDPMLILYSMQLETTYLILKKTPQKAFKWFQKSLKEYEQSPNKQLSIQVAKQYARAGDFLMSGDKKNKQTGYKFLCKAYDDVKKMQKYIEKHYSSEFINEHNLEKFDSGSINIDRIKKNILESLAKYYFQTHNEEKRKKCEEQLKQLIGIMAQRKSHKLIA